MNVSLAVQVLSASTCDMIQNAIANDNMMQNIRLDFDRYYEILNVISKVNLLEDMCNSTLSGSNHLTKFTIENATQVIEEYLRILFWFNNWKVRVFSKDYNKRMNYYQHKPREAHNN